MSILMNRIYKICTINDLQKMYRECPEAFNWLTKDYATNKYWSELYSEEKRKNLYHEVKNKNLIYNLTKLNNRLEIDNFKEIRTNINNILRQLEK